MKKYQKTLNNNLARLFSFIVAVMIIVASIPASFTMAITDEQEEKIAALKTAWQNLRITKTELFAIPSTTYRLTTADATDLTAEEKAAFGDYYYMNSDGVQHVYHTAKKDATGTRDFAKYTDKENVRYTFSYKVIFDPSSTKNFQVNIEYSKKGFTGPYLASTELKTYTITPGTDWGYVKEIQIKNPSQRTIYVGCIYASYDEAIALPENCDSFTVSDWITAANSLDLSSCADTTAFKEALNALSATIDEGAVLNDFLQAWKGLRVEKSELFAIPTGAHRAKTAEATNLTDEEKAAFGEYYYYTDIKRTIEYVPVNNDTASYADFSEKEHLRYKFSYKINFGSHEKRYFEATFQNKGGEYKGIWLATGDTLAKGTFNAVENDMTAVKQIQIKNSYAHTLYVGCIYACYYEPVDLPLYSENFTVYDWIAAAESLDLTNCVDTTAFKTALTALREFTQEGKAFNQLVDAWGDLKVTRTELFAIPSTTYRLTTADATDLTAEEKAAFGDYYYKNSDGVQHIYHTAKKDAANTRDFAKYTDKENVRYTFSYKVIFDPSSTKNFQVNIEYSKKGWTGPYLASTKLETYTITTGTDWGYVKEIQIKNPNKRTIYVGCIYASYDEPLDMPENVELMSLRELIKTAKALDLSVVSKAAADAFTAEIATAENAIQPIVINEERAEKLQKDLISVWKELTYHEEELWAIPESKYCKPTTEDAAKALGLSAEDLGAYYADVNLPELTNKTLYFTSPDGSTSFDTLSNAIKLTVSYSFKDSDGKVAKDGNGKVDLQFNHKETDWPNSYSHTLTIKEDSKTFADYFSGTKSVTNVKLFKNSSSKYTNIAIGSIYKVVVKNEELPYGYENMKLPVLVEYASELDMEKYISAADNFTNILNAARGVAEAMVISKSENLISVAEACGVNYSKDLALQELVSTAMAQDVTSISDKQSFLNALWDLRLYTCDGAAIENLKQVWVQINNSLPENYAQLSVKQWIDLAEKLEKSADSALQEKFEYELRQLKYYYTGIPEITELKKYVEIASAMDSNNFEKTTWSNFYRMLTRANEVINNPSAYTQTKVDQVLEELLSVWGELKYYERTMYVDFNDYFQSLPDVKVSFKPQDTRNTYTELVKDIKLQNGVDRAIKVVNTTKKDGAVNCLGKQLMPLNGYSSLEFYIKLEDFEMPKGYAMFSLQLMNKAGTEWFDYYFSVTANNAEEGWVRIIAPISKFENFANGKKRDGIYMNENGFIAGQVKIFLQAGSGTYSISNIVALKECTAVSGVAPAISPISVYRAPEVVKTPPKNPFSGVDRGDPWGDEYRLTLKNDVVPGNLSENPGKKDVKGDGASYAYVYVIIAVSLVLAGLITGFIIFFIKKRRGKTQSYKES